VKRSITIAGHRTSVWIEDAFWDGLGEIASKQGKSTAALIAEIDRRRSQKSNLSSAIRVFVLDRFRERRETKPAG
jgi:predicted DNA-binding ribbon-helix-helix protein